MAYEFPTDPEFTSFSARVEAAVQLHLESGGRVGKDLSDGSCKCPLACLNLGIGHPQQPIGRYIASALGIDERYGTAFTQGFDGVDRNYWPIADPYFQLGLAYRRRFIEGVR